MYEPSDKEKQSRWRRHITEFATMCRRLLETRPSALKKIEMSSISPTSSLKNVERFIVNKKKDWKIDPTVSALHLKRAIQEFIHKCEKDEEKLKETKISDFLDR